MVDGKTAAQDAPGRGARHGLLENRAFVLFLIVAVQVVLAFALTQLVIVPRLGTQTAGLLGTGTTGAASAVPATGVIVGLEEIIVTLDADSLKPRYLRINVNLEVVDDATADTVRERIPELRDAVIMTLSTKSVADLATAPDKRRLRDEIFRDVAARLPAGTLLNVYFSYLVVQ